MKIGTCHFQNIYTAFSYYRPYGLDSQDVIDKIENGEIELGPPPIKEGESLSIEEGRYFINS